MSKTSFESSLKNVSATGYPERNLAEDLPYVPDHLARYAFAAHWALGRRVADICCGVGYGTNLLAAAGATEVYGVDISSVAIEEAKRSYSTQRVRFFCSDATISLPIPDVDIAVCFEGIEHVSQPDAFLANITGSLAPDGIALFSTPNAASFPDNHSGNPYHIREYQLQEFNELLSRHFGKVKMFFQWSLNDPYDFQWNFTNILKALIPVPVKHAFRTWVRRKPAESGQSSRLMPLNIGASFRPFPVTYLSLPGMRYAQPPIWVAVCEAPRRSD